MTFDISGSIHQSLVDPAAARPSEAGQPTHQTPSTSVVLHAPEGLSFAQNPGREAKQVSRNEIKTMMAEVNALDVEINALRKEVELIKNPSGFRKFIDGFKSIASKVFGFSQKPTNKLDQLENEIKILGHRSDALCDKMELRGSSGPAQAPRGMRDQPLQEDLQQARELAGTGVELIEEAHDEVAAQLPIASQPPIDSQPKASFEPFMERKFVEIIFGPQPDLPTQTSEEPAGVGGLPPPPPPPPPPPKSKVPDGGAVDLKAAFASDVALCQKLQKEGHPVSFSRQIQCVGGETVSVKVTAALHSKADEVAYQRQLRNEAAKLSAKIEDLKRPTENLKQQVLNTIKTIQNEVASGARGTQTVTLPSGMPVQCKIILSNDYSQNPLQFFNDLERLKTDGLITDDEYGQLQGIKRDLTAKQTEYTNILANIQKLETVKQELEMASREYYLPTGSPMFDNISLILSQRAQLPTESQAYWNDFSYESLERDLQHAKVQHQQVIEQKTGQLNQKRADLDAAKAQYSQLKVGFLDILGRSSLSESERSRLRGAFSSDDGFAPPGDSKQERDLLGEVNPIKDKEIYQAYKRLLQFNPQGIQANIEKLTEEIKTLQEGSSSIGLQPVFMKKSAQISIEQRLHKITQGSKSADFAKLRNAVQFISDHPLAIDIKTNRPVAPSSEFKAHEALLENFAKQIGINMGEIKDAGTASNVLPFIKIAEHVKTHNSAQDIHMLALDMVGSNVLSQAPNDLKLNVIFSGYASHL
ncbi:MAG: hypothetical protein LBJ78_01070 [Puniceicoccales bacterium]|jgi:hypothetical protein|nr:hypothetical protein [Puniceicoccales bacterium]